MEVVNNSGDWRSEFMPDVMKIPDLNMDYWSSTDEEVDQLHSVDVTCAARTIMEDYNQKIFDDLHSRETSTKGTAAVDPSHSYPSVGYHSSMFTGSVDATGLACADDWKEEIYQKIQYMKVKYLEELCEQHEKIRLKLESLVLLGKHAKRIERFKRMKTELDGFIGWLNIKKKCVLPQMKRRLSYYDRRIMNFLASLRRITRASSKVQDQHSGGDTVNANGAIDTSLNDLEYDRMISNMHSRETEIKGSVDAFVGIADTFDWKDEIYQTV